MEFLPPGIYNYGYQGILNLVLPTYFAHESMARPTDSKHQLYFQTQYLMYQEPTTVSLWKSLNISNKIYSERRN